MSKRLTRTHGKGATTLTATAFGDETNLRLLMQNGESQMMVYLTVEECRQLSRDLVDLGNALASRIATKPSPM